VAQLVLWHVVDGFEWATIAEYSKGWAGPGELSLAREFAARLAEARPEPGKDLPLTPRFDYELTSRVGPDDPALTGLRHVLETGKVLGLATHEGIPARPEAPSLSCRIRVEEGVLGVQLSASSDDASSWKTVAKFSVATADADGQARGPVELVDELAASALGRLVEVKLAEKGKRAKGRPHEVTIVNRSPLVLNAISLAGPKADASSADASCAPEEAAPATMLGMGLAPNRSVSVPVSDDAIDRLHLADGVRPVAARLGGL
jgi:hypothetical protein